jgi:thymidine phosphorylase
VRTARGAGLPAVALLTDMDRVLGRTAGNALEVAECLALLRGGAGSDPERVRLRELTLALAAEGLHLAGLHASVSQARAAAERAWDRGDAAERFARMVAAQDGPADVWRDAGLPAAPVQRAVPAPRSGFVGAVDVRALGLAVVALGGGRARPGQAVDPRVGLGAVRAPGEAVAAGEALAVVHAADEASAEAAVAAVRQTMPVEDMPRSALPLIRQRIR